MKQTLLHLKAPCNWINDPNGFIFYKGKYHLFYQHFPFSPVWGTMYWGHAVSPDLVHWEHKGIALFPSKDFDRNGVFSGSAIEIDGKLCLYYSAVRYLNENAENIHLPKDWEFETSQAMVVSGDGEKFDNWNNKKQIIPVIRDEEIADSKDTRDPKVWKENDRYYMILGSTIRGEEGKVVIYISEDGFTWDYLSSYRDKRYGRIIECPDLFLLEDKRVFIASLIDIGEEGKEYPNLSIWSFADFDAEKGELKLSDTYNMLDYGGDIYAPQTNIDEAGRRVMIGWMRMPEPVSEDGIHEWIGMMCLPRWVILKDNHICFLPHPNVRACFTKKINPEYALSKNEPVMLKASLGEGQELNIGGFRIFMEQGMVCSDRSSVFRGLKNYKLVSRTPKVKDVAELEIYVEQNLIEIFINNGEYVISNVVYGLNDRVTGSFKGAWVRD